MTIDIDHPAIRVGADALFGQHPERGGVERDQAVFTVLNAVIDAGLMREALYSNCVILEFAAPITRNQLERIKRIIEDNSPHHFPDARLPELISHSICAKREGNTVVPSIAADED